ncbi:type I polyketide synthase [Methylococcus sp. EFPC2]|uniref:type I polyketide synthase n=1 Tax=Methylococcus sp. EFPC2 TaxID=2812648 RepID=UPI0019675E29|nr:type I polyketide synthase [Methylococcus sp. EFPC2]QSA96532.1 SDR family NAD(P)-dependent oxidoreductase [Methylococcus sp. EFPC2]
MSASRTQPIAVIGMACRYPGASTLLELWENVLTRRQQFRDLPDVRLPLSEYHDPNPAAPDKTYGKKAAVMDGFEFDASAYRIPRTTFETTDIVHWLALSTALEAVKHAGLSGDGLHRERAGVILGNTLTGEETRANTLRLRWPFVRKILRRAADAHGLSAASAQEFESTVEQMYKSVFPPITEDTLAGGLANTIAGRICNYLDLHGGGYIVDGACSSSLLSIATAADYLHQNKMDLVIAGGVDVSLDTFELIGFSKATALSKDEMRVYDRRGSGFIPGEGCGMVLLKRLEDARRDGDTVYAVLRGWGVSSDGRGGITAPSAKGQSRALVRAYQGAGYAPQSLSFIEGHGTGTAVGDRIELEGIADALAEFGGADDHAVGVTSFKSIVGHTKAAAGIGGFIKTVMAVNRRVIPPTAGCGEPHASFADVARALYPVLEGRIREPQTSLRAGVSAMGFGGINCHVTLESGDAPAPQLAPELAEQALLASWQNSEVIPFSAEDAAGLIKRVEEARAHARGLSSGELIDFAAHHANRLQNLPWRAAVLAGGIDELNTRLDVLVQRLREAPLAPGELWRSDLIWASNAVESGTVGFIFPGQGSQQIGMARGLVNRFAWAEHYVTETDAEVAALRQECGRSLEEESFSKLYLRRGEPDPANKREPAWLAELTRTENAQPGICVASWMWARRLEELGIVPSVVGGHSLGELTAFAVAGGYDAQTLARLAALRGIVMAAQDGEAGSMGALACDVETATSLLDHAGGYCVIANANSPQQTVISGEAEAVRRIVEAAVEKGFRAQILPVSNGFHSRLVEPAAERLRQSQHLPEHLDSLRYRMFSGIDGREIDADVDIKDYLARQIVSKVSFTKLLETLSEHCDWLVEVGPGRVLSGLAQSHDPSLVRFCMPVESRPGRDADLNAVMAEAFVRGRDLRWDRLYEERLVRPLVPAAERKFYVNPCEREPLPVTVRKSARPFGQELLSVYDDNQSGTPELMLLSDQLNMALCDVVRAEQAILLLFDEAENALRPVMPAHGFVNRIPANLGIFGDVLRSAQAETVDVLLNDPRFDLVLEGLGAFPTWTALYAPVLTGVHGQAVGVVRLVRRPDDPFTAMDAHMVADLAGRAAPALIRAYLRQRVHEVQRIDHVLENALNERWIDHHPKPVLSHLLESAKSALGAEHARILVHDAEVHELRAWSADAASRPVTVSADAGLVGHAFRALEPVHVANVTADARYRPEADEVSGLHVQRLDYMPIVSPQGEPLGVLQVVNGRLPEHSGQLAKLARYAGAWLHHQPFIEQLEAVTDPSGQAAAPRLAAVPVVSEQSLALDTSGQGSRSARGVLLRLICERTGFAVHSIPDDARLIDDLNLDSIKIGTLLADAAIELGVAGQIDAMSLGNANVGAVITAFEAVSQPANDRLTAWHVLLGLIAERTGFAEDCLNRDQRLLDDLNIDSIKAASLLGDLLLQTGTQNRVEAGPLANATLGEIANTVQAAMASASEKGTTAAATPPTPWRAHWVRAFSLSKVPESFSTATSRAPYGDELKPLLIAPGGHSALGQALAEALGTELLVEISAERAISPVSTLILMLGDNRTDGSVRPSSTGVDQLATLHRLASERPEVWQGVRTVAFVQSQGSKGQDGVGGPTAWSFAASLYLERPDLEVVVLDFDPALSADFVTGRVKQELTSEPRYQAIEYDLDGLRWKRCMTTVEPEYCSPRNLTWSADDVLLVTGGGKGITAECALAFARETGVKLALVGRSRAPSSDEAGELADNLRKLAEVGVEHRYYAADVADRQALAEVIAQIQEDLGPVTAVLHGAGSNAPRRVVDVSAAQARLEIAPKLQGAENLLALLDAAPLKMFAAFTSIIGVTGMHNNAWYAYSNETVARLLEGFSARHPDTAVVSYAFGVWDSVGMGVKLGSVRHLGQMGIDAISVEEGVRQFMRWTRSAPPTQEVIITASSSGLATWARPTEEKRSQALRFDGALQRFEPGIEKVTRVTLNTEQDLYLADHDYRGSLLMPTVMGLEAMAQACLHVAGNPRLEVVRIENIQLERPIVVGRDRPTTIEIRALALERVDAEDARVIEASIHTDQTGLEPAHFAARFILGQRREAKGNLPVPRVSGMLGIVPSLELYGGVLFQGPLFQRISAIEALDEKHVVFVTETRPDTLSTPEGFAEDVRGPLVLGDPYYRDTLLQAAQLSLTPDICLPIRIDCIDLYASRDPAGRYRAEAKVVGREGRRVLGEVTVFDEQGRLIEHIRGYEVQVLERRADFPTPAELVREPNVPEQRVLQEALAAAGRSAGLSAPAVALRRIPHLHGKNRADRRALALPIMHATLQSAARGSRFNLDGVEVSWLDSGKPVVGIKGGGSVRAATDAPHTQEAQDGDRELGISISHEDDLLLCVAGTGPQGCDLVVPLQRTRKQWRAMLNQPLFTLVKSLEGAGLSLDQAGARVWAALEAGIKALDSRDIVLELDEYRNGRGLFVASNAAHRVKITTLPLVSGDGAETVVSVVLGPRGEEPLADMAVADDPDAVTLDALGDRSSIPFAEPETAVVASSDSWSGWLSSGGITADFFSVQADFDNKAAEPRVLFRFPLAFKDGANPDGSVYFVRFFEWMGRLREMALRPVLGQLADEFASGKWAWVTNRSWVKIERPARAGDVVEVSCRFLGRGGPNDSMVSVGFEWHRVAVNGALEKLATSQIQMTWAKVIAHGVVSPEAYPPYLDHFFRELTAVQGDSENSDAMCYRRAVKLIGGSLWRKKQGPETGILLAEHSCGTTSNDANLVGNIYYSKYYELQGVLRDSHFFGVVPDAYRMDSAHGGIRCVYTEVSHLRDAMPFDTLRARMYVNAVHERGIELGFEFFRIMPNGDVEKLATGVHVAAWMTAKEDGSLGTAMDLPNALSGYLLSRVPTGPTIAVQIDAA